MPHSGNAVAKTILPSLNLSIPAFAIVGMAAMVGGGTGAAMTAVTMIFEMTRDYDIVMPMIIAVAVSIGVRRVLSHENIYTIKLVSRRHFIPKALHANMFLVHQARDVMDRDILLLPTNMSFDAFLRQPKHEGKIRLVVVARDVRSRQKRDSAFSYATKLPNRSLFLLSPNLRLGGASWIGLIYQIMHGLIRQIVATLLFARIMEIDTPP